MKKLLSILALALCFVACQNEQVENVQNSDLVEVVLNVGAPEVSATRAGENGEDDSVNGKDSAYGAIDYADDAFWGKYDLRYTLEVYAADDVDGSKGPVAKERMVNYLDKYAETEFKLRLVPNREYKFVVFADFVEQGVEGVNLFYDTTDLTKITSLTDGEEWYAMNEARDAYFISENVNVTTGLTKSLILTRPFAKLRVVTTDILDLEKYSTPDKVVVTYYNHPIYKSFNAVNGAIATEMSGDELTYVVEYADQYTAGYDDATQYPSNMTLFADYVHATNGTVNFRMDVYEEGGRLIKSNDFSTEIPVERNHLTTIMGNALTTLTNIKILISDEFDGTNDVTMPEGLFDNDTVVVTGIENGSTYANGAYSFDVANAETGDKFTLNILDAALTYDTLATNGTLAEGEYDYGTHFTATNVELNLPVSRAAVALTTVNVEGGKMAVKIDKDNNYALTIDLEAYNPEYKTEWYRPTFGYYGPFSVAAVEQLAQVVKFAGEVKNGLVTFTWEAVEKATSYVVTFNDIEKTVTEGTTTTFPAPEATEESKTYTATIVAKADSYKASEPATYDVVIAKAEEPEPTEAYKLYFNNLAKWAKVYAHIWANEGEDLGLKAVEWPGRELTETEELDGVTYYVFQLPAEATGKTVNVVFNDGAGTQTNDLAGVVEGDLFFDNYVEPVEPTDVKLYLNTGSYWYNDNDGYVWFAAYFFSEAGNDTWVKMEAVEGEEYLFETTVPEGNYGNVIFTMMYGNKTSLDWGSKKNQTIDLVIPTDSNNCYTIENPWDESQDWKAWGTWSAYTPATQPQEPTALATPVVTYEINEGNSVTLSWEAIEGAKDYTATLNGNEKNVDVTYVTFDNVAAGTYTATVVANPTDETKNTASEAGTVEVTVEAPVVEPTYTTVAEFLALSGDDVIPSDAKADVIAAAPRYTLKGTITSVTETTYGNFYLNDGTGEVLIYGLCSPEGEAKYWAASGAKVGDDIVVKTIRTEYNNAPQGKNATFVELLPGTLAFWLFDATATSFTAAGGDKEIGLAIYNATAEVITTSNNAQFSATYADGTLTITAMENTTANKIEGNITVTCGSLSQVVTVTQAKASSGDQTEVEAEVVFSSDNRTTFTTSQQVFEANNVKVINDKGSSANNVADYAKPARFYKNSKITVAAPGNITTIVFDCNSASYATALNSSNLTGTVSVSSDKVTVTLDGSSNEYVISSLTGGQVRMDGVTVTYLQ